MKFYADEACFSVDDLPDLVFDLFLVSSVPSKNHAVIDELKSKREINSIEIFDPAKQELLTNIYPGLGADRVAKLIGALELNPGKNVILMDFGTATTISVANSKKEFLGGFITLGMRASLRALSEECEALADFSEDMDYDLNAVSEFNSSKQAMLHGTYFAHLGLVNEWIYQAKKLIGDPSSRCYDATSTVTICTGGDAIQFERHFDKYIESGDLLLALIHRLKAHN